MARSGRATKGWSFAVWTLGAVLLTGVAGGVGAEEQKKATSAVPAPLDDAPLETGEVRGAATPGLLPAPAGADSAAADILENDIATPADLNAPAVLPEERARAIALSDALAEVWRTHPQVQKAESTLLASGFDVSASRTGYFPYVAVQNEQSNNNGNSGIVRVIQPLWSGGLTGAQVDGAKAQQKGALADLNRTRLQLGLNTVDAYLNVVSATEQSLQWQNYINDLRQLLKVIQRRAAEGVAPQSDVQTAKTRLSQAEAGYQANLSQLESGRAQLGALLNFDPGDVSWPDDSHKLTEEEVLIAGTAVTAHPEHQFAQAGVEVQEATARAAKASLWPTVSAEYRHALQNYSTDSGNDDSVLLNLQYQTDSGLKAFQQYRGDKQRLESAKATLVAADRSAAAAVKVARTDRRAAQIQFKAQVEAAEASRALVDSFMRQFEVGRKSWLEVLNAQREANDTVLSAVAVRRNFWIANGHLALQGLLWRRISDGAPDINAISDE